MLTATVVDYYNGFRSRLMEDYTLQNERVVAALEFANKHLDEAYTILDVGCGIGWSTNELAACHAKVVGLDISPVLINTARAMFPDHTFVAADFVDCLPVVVDGVVMIDVYEHFAREDWPKVHRQIRRTGASRVVLTMPTPATQQYARDHGVALQPIDEDVTDQDIRQLTDGVGGVLLVNKYVTISRPNDYRHVLIAC